MAGVIFVFVLVSRSWCEWRDGGRGGMFMLLKKGGVNGSARVEGWVVWCEGREPTCHELCTANI